MKRDEYLRLLKIIMEKDDISDEVKIIYLQMLDLVKDYNKKDLELLEDRIYEVDNHKLSDKEKVIYELNRLLDYGEDSDILKKIAYLNSKVKNTKDLERIKIDISEKLIKSGKKPSFYSIYLDLLKKYCYCKDDNNNISKKKYVK